MSKPLQETFDHVCTALLAQGRPSAHPISGRCKYRSPDNTKCAVGHCISDSDYSPEMENLSIKGLLQKYPPTILGGHNYDLLRSLQCCHDYFPPELLSLITPEKWLETFKTQARKTAITYDLNPKVLG